MKTFSDFVGEEWWRFSLEDDELSFEIHRELRKVGFCIRREVNKKEWGKERFALCTLDITLNDYALDTLYVADSLKELMPFVKLLVGG